jgi:hypothetical protein
MPNHPYNLYTPTPDDPQMIPTTDDYGHDERDDAVKDQVDDLDHEDVGDAGTG